MFSVPFHKLSSKRSIEEEKLSEQGGPISPRLRIPLNIFGSNMFRPLFKFLRVQYIITLYLYYTIFISFLPCPLPLTSPLSSTMNLYFVLLHTNTHTQTQKCIHIHIIYPYITFGSCINLTKCQYAGSL